MFRPPRGSRAHISRAEAPRLSVLGGALYVANSHGLAAANIPRSMHLAQVAEPNCPNRRGVELADDHREHLAPSDGAPERTNKNRSPWVIGERLYFLHRGDSLRVAAVPLAQLAEPGAPIWLQEKAVVGAHLPRDYGLLRGGTLVAWVPQWGQYLTFFHSPRRCRMAGEGKPRRQYLTGACTLSGPAPSLCVAWCVRPLSAYRPCRTYVKPSCHRFCRRPGRPAE